MVLILCSNTLNERSGVGIVVIALAYHLGGPSSTGGHELVKLVVGSLLCSERFFSGFSGFPLSSKINISKFQFDRMQDLPENHFRVSGACWVNITNYLIKVHYVILVFEHDNRRNRSQVILGSLRKDDGNGNGNDDTRKQ